MNYAKQKDGRSWLFYEKTAKGRRSIALAVLAREDEEPELTIERLECTDADEAELQKRLTMLRDRIRRDRSKIAIYCEGQTESRYLREIANALGITSRIQIFAVNGGDPGAHIEAIAKNMLWEKAIGKESFGEYWMVFDRDGHHGFHSAFEIKSHFKSIHLAFTNPCFEYWVAMHHPKYDGKIPLTEEHIVSEETKVELCGTNRKRIVHVRTIELGASPDDAFVLASRLFPGYKKNAEGYLSLFGAHTERVYERMKALPSPQNGLGSDLPALIDRLFALSGLTRSEGFARLGQGASTNSSGETANSPQSLQKGFNRKEFAMTCEILSPRINDFRKMLDLNTAKLLNDDLLNFLRHIKEAILIVPQMENAIPPLEPEQQERITIMLGKESTDASYLEFCTRLGEINCVVKSFSKNPDRKFKNQTRLKVRASTEYCLAWLNRCIGERSQIPENEGATP